jgi:hypothetical protein
VFDEFISSIHGPAWKYVAKQYPPYRAMAQVRRHRRLESMVPRSYRDPDWLKDIVGSDDGTVDERSYEGLSEAKRLEKFQLELADLTERSGLKIEGCGCDDSPSIVDMTTGRTLQPFIEWDINWRFYRSGKYPHSLESYCCDD